MKAVLLFALLFISGSIYAQDSAQYKIVKEGGKWAAMNKNGKEWKYIHLDTLTRVPGKKERFLFKRKEEADSVLQVHKKATERAKLQEQLYQQMMRSRRQ